MSTVTPLKRPPRTFKIAFQRREMSLILDAYGRMVMAGHAKDYAIGMYKDQAVFAIFRRHAENPTWQVIKTPSMSNAQGAFAVLGGQGQTLKRGRDLKQVLRVFDSRKFSVVS
ncbi:MAG: DUF2794 domain-containing protein [Pseudomonadota bacterium]